LRRFLRLATNNQHGDQENFQRVGYKKVMKRVSAKRGDASKCGCRPTGVTSAINDLLGVIPLVNSKTYRSQNVQKVDMAQILAGREGQSAVVGVGVGKQNLYLMVRWAGGQAGRPVVTSGGGAIDPHPIIVYTESRYKWSTPR
jgi:hypothetical protein